MDRLRQVTGIGTVIVGEIGYQRKDADPEQQLASVQAAATDGAFLTSSSGPRTMTPPALSAGCVVRGAATKFASFFREELAKN